MAAFEQQAIQQMRGDGMPPPHPHVVAMRNHPRQHSRRR
jgi:hypothetical protein